MQASKSAVAVDYNKAKVKVGNLEAAVKEKEEDQAANHQASHFTCVCQAKQGCRIAVFVDFCVSMLSLPECCCVSQQLACAVHSFLACYAA